ncbi:MAG: enoyl-CoA hydratase-related protein [Deltaproteobacteria bacterium]|nr:enoyl-CoA hydratase-related protein [Deltaproteobacteria bacterium]
MEAREELPVIVSVVDHVATLTFNRPAARNALSRGLVEGSLSALEQLTGNPDVRCLVVTGAGDAAFCAGADLKERRGMDSAATEAFLDRLCMLCDGFAAFPKPVIAAINGAAFGGGLELALACDIRIAVSGAQMGLPEVTLGIFPGAGGTQRLARICGVGVAKGLILTGRRIDADEAMRLGVIHAVSAPQQLAAELSRWTQSIVDAAPLAVSQAKFAIDAGLSVDPAEGFRIARAAYRVVLHSADRNEGLAAFAEKRKPTYQGK